MKQVNATAHATPVSSSTAQTPIPTECCGSLPCCPSSASPSALLRCWGEPRSEPVDPDRREPVAAHAIRAERHVQDRRAPGHASRREDEVAECPRNERVPGRRGDSAENVRMCSEYEVRAGVQARGREQLLTPVRRRMQLDAPMAEAPGD